MSQEPTDVQIVLEQHEKFGSIRAVNLKGVIWFFATDAAAALGYQSPSDAVRAHCKKAKSLIVSDTAIHSTENINDNEGKATSPQTIRIIDEKGRPYINYNKLPLIIPESDLYRLIMRSNLPQAEEFQDWVVEDVLPSIRKKGHYGKPQTKLQYLAEVAIEWARVEAEQLAQKEQLTDHDNRLTTVEEYVEEDRRSKAQAQRDLFDLTKNADLPPEKTTRSVVNEIVRQYAMIKGLPPNQVWIKVYTEFRYRYHQDIMRRAKNAKLSYIEMTERMGMLNDLLKVAQIVCQPPKQALPSPRLAAQLP